MKHCQGKRHDFFCKQSKLTIRALISFYQREGNKKYKPGGEVDLPSRSLPDGGSVATANTPTFLARRKIYFPPGLNIFSNCEENLMEYYGEQV